MGLDTIRHGYELDDEAVEACYMLPRHVLVPTLLVLITLMARWDTFKDIPMLNSVPVRYAAHRQCFDKARQGGVKIAAPPVVLFAAVAGEIRMMVACGCSPTDALSAATSVASEARAGGIDWES